MHNQWQMPVSNMAASCTYHPLPCMS